MNACGWDWCISLQGAERCSHAASSRCLFSGCVLCCPGSKRKWERIPSQSVWKMTHQIIFCISNITLAFLPIYRYSQARPPARRMYLYLYILRNASVNTFSHFLNFIFIFFHIFSSQTGTERPKLQPTQCNSCKHDIPRVQLTTSLVPMILPISGLTETGQNGSGVLGSPWPIWLWGRKKQLSWGMFLHRERATGRQKQCNQGWEGRYPCSFPLYTDDALQNPAQLQSARPAVYFGREEGNGLRSGRAELRLLLLGKMWMWSSW